MRRPLCFLLDPILKRIVAGLLSCVPLFACAAGSEPSPWFGLVKVALSLGVILLAIYLVLSFMRRLMVSGLPGGAQPLLRLRGGLMLGQRERVVVIEIEETWLVVGVSGSQMTLLHTLPKGETADAVQSGSLAEQWQAIWNKRKAGGQS